MFRFNPPNQSTKRVFKTHFAKKNAEHEKVREEFHKNTTTTTKTFIPK